MRKKKQKTRLYAYAGAGVITAGVCFLTYLYIATPAPLSAAEQKKVLYPVPYSDTRITENAIATDPRFKTLATFDRNSFLANAASSFRIPAPAPEASQPEKGTWLWTPTLSLTPAYRDSIIAHAKRSGIRTIYLSLDSYLDIYVMPDGPDKDAKKKAFDTILEQFIAAAHTNGISVDAEAGWRNWAEPGNEYKAFALVDYAIGFNAAHNEKLRGLQYDIEPYLLESYAKSKKAVLRNFIDLIHETLTRLNGSDLLFSVVIPDFYDGSSGETPRFFYGLSYQHAFTHLLKALERRPGSQLLVMAYRNFTAGDDGSIALVADEVREANVYRTKVIVAQETGDFPPPYITFHGTSLAHLNAQLQDIEETFAEQASYHGIAIHYINALMELR